MSTIAKLRPADSRSFNSATANQAHKYYEDDDDDDEDEMDWEDEVDVPPSQYSDDYSSSEDLPYQYDPRTRHRSGGTYGGSNHGTYSGSQPRSGGRSLGAFGSYSVADQPDQNATIERLKMEMGGIRRQSQDAVNASLRLSDQLTACQQEVAQIRSELKAAQNMVEEERMRRIQAEKAADDEARRRRAAEDALRQQRAQNAQARRAT